MLVCDHEARWAHTESRDVRKDTSHGGAARQSRRKTQRGDQALRVASHLHLSVDSSRPHTRCARIGRAQTPWEKARAHPSAEGEGSPVDLRQRSTTVWIRFWTLDAENRRGPHSGETRRDVRADRHRETLARTGDDAAETAPSRLRTRPDRDQALDAHRVSPPKNPCHTTKGGDLLLGRGGGEIGSGAGLGRTWGEKGKTPEVPTSGQRQSINAISAVNARGAFWYEVYAGRFNATRFKEEFLQSFMRGRTRPVFLVVDGHPAHRAKIIASYITQLKGRLELHFLPGYAPELNPDEFVWNDVKREGTSKKPLKRNESLRQRVEGDRANIKRRPALGRSFFRAPSVLYTRD